MNSLENFLSLIPALSEKTPADLVGYFVYYLTVVNESAHCRPSEIGRCFTDSRITPYSNISAYLVRQSARGKNQKFIKSNDGYVLTRSAQLEIQHSLSTGPARIETSILLRNLLHTVPNLHEREFLQEVINCYEIGARRSAIVMMWILTIDHICNFVLENQVQAFNNVLEANTDKRVKIKEILKADDFSEIPEGKLIDFLRQSNIISNDVRKILEVKLGIRNSAAHPSGISLSEVKATDFIIDLVQNVVVKYPRQ